MLARTSMRPGLRGSHLHPLLEIHTFLSLDCDIGEILVESRFVVKAQIRVNSTMLNPHCCPILVNSTMLNPHCCPIPSRFKCFSVFRQSTRYEFTISIAPRIIFRSEVSEPPNWNKKKPWDFLTNLGHFGLMKLYGWTNMSCFSLKSHEIPRTALPRQVLALNVLWMAIELELEGTAAGD